MWMADADTVWNSLEIAKFAVSAATPAVIVWVGYIINRKLDGLKTASEWKKTWAEKFLKCSNSFSDCASELVVNIHIWSELNNQKLDRWEEKAEFKHSEILGYLDKIKFYDWELGNYVQFAGNNRKSFLEAEKKLFKLLSELVSYCKNPDGRQFDLEGIREAQFEYNKIARDMHSELMGISK